MSDIMLEKNTDRRRIAIKSGSWKALAGPWRRWEEKGVFIA